MNKPSMRETLDSIAWAAVGLCLAGSFGYCVVGVLVTLVVEHLGWFAALSDVSAWMLATLHVAGYVFAASCVLVTLGAGGAYMAIVVPAAFAILVLFVVVGYGVVQLLAYLKPLFVIVLANLWWGLGALTVFVLTCFAVSTSPKNGYGYLLFAIVLHAAVLSGLCVYAVFASEGFSNWSPWVRLAMSFGVTATCLGAGVMAIQLLVGRWPPSADTRNTLETWLVPLGGAAVFAAGYGLWRFSTVIVGYESWLAQLTTGLAVGGALAFAGLIAIGAVLGVIENES